jgi:hypothetical protein
MGDGVCMVRGFFWEGRLSLSEVWCEKGVVPGDTRSGLVVSGER